MKKRAAIELSMSTVVIVVLAMSMLILGVVLVKNIFSGTTSVVDMTNDQMEDQISQLFGEDSKLVVYPSARQITVEMGETDGFGIGIKNLVGGSSGGTFSYEVIVSDEDIESKCGVTEEEALSWIVTGRTEKDIGLAAGESVTGKVLIHVPEGTTICTFRYRVNSYYNGNNYASELMDVTISA